HVVSQLAVPSLLTHLPEQQHFFTELQQIPPGGPPHRSSGNLQVGVAAAAGLGASAVGVSAARTLRNNAKYPSTHSSRYFAISTPPQPFAQDGLPPHHSSEKALGCYRQGKMDSIGIARLRWKRGSNRRISVAAASQAPPRSHREPRMIGIGIRVHDG